MVKTSWVVDQLFSHTPDHFQKRSNDKWTLLNASPPVLETTRPRVISLSKNKVKKKKFTSPYSDRDDDIDLKLSAMKVCGPRYKESDKIVLLEICLVFSVAIEVTFPSQTSRYPKPYCPPLLATVCKVLFRYFCESGQTP